MSRMLLRWRIGPKGYNCDLSKFYPSLRIEEKHWHLQRMLFTPSMKASEAPKEFIITSLIFGIASVAAQTEEAITKIGVMYDQHSCQV